jgi:hypothetical protein
MPYVLSTDEAVELGLSDKEYAEFVHLHEMISTWEVRRFRSEEGEQVFARLNELNSKIVDKLTGGRLPPS